MGLLDRHTRDSSIEDGVAGEAKVLEKELSRAGSQPEETRDRIWKLRLAVVTPAAEPYEVEHTCTIPWDRVPRTGESVPVTVSRSHPERLRVEWDQAGSLTESAKLAKRLVEAGDLHAAAAAMRTGGPGRFVPKQGT